MPKADLFTCASCDGEDAEDVVVCTTCAIGGHRQHDLEPYVRATQRDVEEARRTLKDHQIRVALKAEEATNLIE
ncbi:hypothetical protein AAVH_27053 [Aphelenchoides avenae]|nr:hypothetical protein AAVH_27053 [Aphelenchus avenae]